MKILMISTDKKIFEENSEVRQRMVEYGGLAEEIHIIVLAGRNFQFPISNFQTIFNSLMTKISNNVFVYSTNSKSKLFYICDAIKIGTKILKEKLNDSENEKWLVTTQDPFETGFVGWKLSKKFNLPLQIQIHTDFLSPYFGEESLLNRVRVIVAKFLISKANSIRVVSERIKKSLIDELKISESKITVLPVFVDIEKMRNTSVQTDLHQKYSQFDFIVLMASRLTKEKNIGMAIDAMKDVCDESNANKHIDVANKNVGLIIVGDGPERKKLERLVLKHNLQNNVIFEGWSDGLASYYKTADMFLLTSNYEGYCRTAIEAMAGNCFVVMTNVGIAGDVIKDGYNGVVIPVGDKERLKEVILRATIKDGAYSGTMVVSAEETLKSFPTKEEYLEKYKESWEK